MQVQVKKAEQLTPEEIATWKQLQAGNPSLESPYFHPEFTLAVASVRSDVEVAILQKQNQVIGFFPFQRGKLGLAKPVGGKVSDYHGVIAAADTTLDGMDLLRQCGLAGWDFDHLPGSQAAFASYSTCTGRSPQMDVRGGLAEYERKRKAAGSDVVSKVKQRVRKTERALGTLELVGNDQDPAVFEQLLAWKSAQYLRTGLADVFSFPWTRKLLEELQRRSMPEFGLVTTTLKVNGKLLSTLLCLRQNSLVHGWFTAYDPEMSEHSPGLLHYLKWIEAAPDLGIDKIDFGKGEETYKWRFATEHVDVLEGTIARPSLGVWLRKGWRATRNLLEGKPGDGGSKGPLSLLKPLRNWLQFQ